MSVQEPSPNGARRGRPRRDTGVSDVRSRLLLAARDLFASGDYARVSTRQVAEQAGSNIGMIRYYFGNKAGLFEAVCTEYFAPVAYAVEQSLLGEGGVVAFLESYYLTMAKTPRLPRMIHRVMSMAETEEQRQILTRVMMRVGGEVALERAMQKQGLLKPGVDAQLAKMSLISMLVFPFLMPDAVRDRNNIELNEPFLRRLARHNAALLTGGILNETQEA